MAAPIPAALKSADISRFALRSAQLEKAKPIIAYWSNYWIVNQIISNNLQNADDESRQYTMHVMDKLEQFKTENAENDAVTDDMAGKAYIEQFGLETFSRAENAVRADKASRQTADTYQASATFLELLQIFGPLDPEISAKVKYAKYHALRIAKALKAGEDPNLSNPKPEPTPEEQAPPLENSDFEQLDRQPSVQEVPDEADRVQRNQAQKSVLDESLHPSRASSVPRPPVPKVEDVPDDTDHISRRLAQQSSLDQSLHPSRAPSIPPTTHVDPTSSSASAPKPDPAENFYTQQQPSAPPDVSPLNPAAYHQDQPPSTTSGGTYFPDVPSPVSPPNESSLPATSLPPPPDLPSAPSDLASPNAPQPPPPPPPTSTRETFISPHAPIPPNLTPQNLPPTTPQPPPPQQRSQQAQSQAFYAASNTVPTAPASVAGHQHVPPDTTGGAGGPVDEEAMMKAQKHARWAISALNFEDVSTAIRELRGALESLGAR